MSTAKLLSDDDFCRRLEYLSRSWERESLSPMQLLARGIESGLTCEAKDPGQHAADRVMELAVSRPIETPRENLLEIAEHHAALADFIVYLLRTGGPWLRPEPIPLGKYVWQPESFLGPNHSLRRVVLCDRWTEERAIAESFDWRTLESAIYDMPMTLVVVVLGASRDGRRHGPLSKGWEHPVSRDLRFRKRDGEDFGSTWIPVFRENFRDDREAWLESMIEDGVLDETVQIFEVPILDRGKRDAILGICASRLDHIVGTLKLPEPQLSQCFDPIRICPFRSCCPYFRMPSELNGFRKVS